MRSGIDRTLPSKIKSAMDQAEEDARATAFALLCKEAGVPEPLREIKVHPERNWKADFLWRPLVYTANRRGVILESEGGIYSGGKHGRGKGIEEDFEKMNELQLLSYTVLRVASHRLATSATVDLVRRALNIPLQKTVTLHG